MTKHRYVIPEDDDFLRDVDPEELERRRRAYEAAKIISRRARERVAAREAADETKAAPTP